MPQAIAAEKAVLSCFLLMPREIGGLCVEKRIKPGHFYDERHRLMFGTLIELWDKNKPCDFIALTQVLRDRDLLHKCGGSAYVTDTFTFRDSPANCAYYLEILEEKWTLRSIIEVGTEYAARAYDQQDEAPSLLQDFERRACAIGSHVGDVSALVGMKQGMVEAIGHIEELYARRGAIGGLSTGFADYDKMTDGLHAAEMTVIAARPSMGKTALAMNMAEHIAINLQKPVAVFSLEMSRQQLNQRLLCSRARVNLANVRDGFLNERDFPALQQAASKLAECRLFIDDRSDLTIQEMRARARRLRAKEDIQAIFIDYLQLARSLSRQASNSREREVSEVSSGLKSMSKELGIPVIVLAQLSRQPERDGKTRRPRLSDLRESGSIEQDADNVGLLVREEYYAETPEERKAVEGEATLIIAKQRNGPVGDVYLTFIKEYARFETRACTRDEEEHDNTESLFK